MKKPADNRWFPQLTGKTVPEVASAIQKLFSNVYDTRDRLDSVSQVASSAISPEQAQEQFSPAAMQKALSVAGSNPLVVHGLDGVLIQPQTAGVKLTTAVPSIQDPISQNGALVSVNGQLYRFTGGAPGQWKIQSAGLIVDTHANRVNYPAATYPKTEYLESDTLLQYASVINATSMVYQWTYQSGQYSINQVNIVSYAGTLVAADAGTLIYVSNFDHVLKWTGGAFGWGPNDSESNFVQLFVSAPSGGGWQSCIAGGTFTYLKGDGTTGNQIIPPPATIPAFLQIGNAIGNAAAVAPTTTPNGGTQNDIGGTMVTQGVVGGTVVTVASHPHSHVISVNADGTPAGFALLPYFRI